MKLCDMGTRGDTWRPRVTSSTVFTGTKYMPDSGLSPEDTVSVGRGSCCGKQNPESWKVRGGDVGLEFRRVGTVLPQQTFQCPSPRFSQAVPRVSCPHVFHSEKQQLGAGLHQPASEGEDRSSSPVRIRWQEAITCSSRLLPLRAIHANPWEFLQPQALLR